MVLKMKKEDLQRFNNNNSKFFITIRNYNIITIIVTVLSLGADCLYPRRLPMTL